MEREYHLLYDFLLTIYTKVDVERIMKGIKNPAKYQWITKELIQIYQRLENDKRFLKNEDHSRLYQIIEDELVNAMLICQDSKCKPFKF